MNLPEGTVKASLKTLGVSIQDERGDELIALCPGHRARKGRVDHKPSWSINTNTGQHHCFSCGYKGNLYTLYVDLRGRDTANDFWGEMTVHGVPLPEGYQVNRELQPHKADLEERSAMPESQLALFTDAPVWAMTKRRVDKAALDFYGVRWSEDHSAWVLPLRNPRTEQLIGYQLKGQQEKIILNKPTGMDKGSTLFGIVEAKEQESVVVVESPLDAVLLHRLGHTAVAVCGSRLTEWQLELLQDFEYVQFALDNDDAGRLESTRLRRMMLGFKYRVVSYGDTDKKDFGEMEYDDIENILAGRGALGTSVGV